MASERLGQLGRRVEHLVAVAPGGLWVIDAESVTALVNPPMAEMLGLQPEEMLGRSLFDFMDDQGRELAERNVERRRQGIREQHDFEFIRADGSRVITSMHTSPLLDADGAYEGAVAFVNDVTEQRRTEHTARYLASVVASIRDAVVSTSSGGEIVSWNAGAVELLGFDSAHVIGMAFRELFPARLREDANLLVAQVARSGGSEHRDIAMLRVDGREVPTALTVSALTDPGGSVTGLAFVIRDMTEHQASGQAVEETNQMLRAIIECAGEGIFVKDRELRYRLANGIAARMIGIEPDAIVGKRDVEFVPAELARVFTDRDREVMACGVRMSQEFSMVDAAGRQLWIAETKSPLFEGGPTSEVAGVVGVVRDITALRAAQDQQRALEATMLQAQKLESLGLLAGGIAHDFNNLLVAVLGHADIAARELPTHSPVQEDLGAIVRTARRASELCRQLLAYAGRGRFVVRRIELSRAVSEVSELLELTLSKRAVLQLQLSPDTLHVEADVTQLRQVLMNLITNASEALGSKGGLIRVTTGATTVDAEYLAGCVAAEGVAPGGFAYVEVSDSGCGMEREVVDRIFDPFYTSKFTGRGLGLAAVQGIVRGHGGAIRVYSEPGRGSSLKVLLPIVSAGSALQAPAGTPAATGRGLVLVIDDEHTVRTLVARALRDSAFEVLLASSGEEGLARFEAERGRIVAVLLDMTMPGMDGKETYSALRRLDAEVPVVLSSGFNEQETTSALAGRGLAGFLPKPYSVQELLDCLSAAVRGASGS